MNLNKEWEERAKEFLIKELNLSPIAANTMYDGYVNATVKFASEMQEAVLKVIESKITDAARKQDGGNSPMANYALQEDINLLTGIKWKIKNVKPLKPRNRRSKVQ